MEKSEHHRAQISNFLGRGQKKNSCHCSNVYISGQAFALPLIIIIIIIIIIVTVRISLGSVSLPLEEGRRKKSCYYDNVISASLHLPFLSTNKEERERIVLKVVHYEILSILKLYFPLKCGKNKLNQGLQGYPMSL